MTVVPILLEYTHHSFGQAGTSAQQMTYGILLHVMCVCVCVCV